MFIYSYNREQSEPSGDVNKFVFANGQTVYVIQVQIFSPTTNFGLIPTFVTSLHSRTTDLTDGKSINPS